MSEMFWADSEDGTYKMKLKSLNLSNFETSKVKSMKAMFQNCINLENLDISNFTTEMLTDTSYMFYNTSSSEVLLNKSLFSSVSNYADMFTNSTIEKISINNSAQNFINSRLTEAGINPTLTVVSA